MANFNPNSLLIYDGRFNQTKHNKLVAQLARQHLRSGPNYILSEGGGGTIIIPTAQGAASSIHAYTVQDASNKSTPRVTVTPGTHNGITPTIYGTPINTKTGTPAIYPILTLGNSDTLVYFQIDYNTAGQITSMEISSGTMLPTATIVAGVAGSDYKLLSTIKITYNQTTGYASVQCFNDAVSGPQGYAQCGNNSNVWLV